jgi:hypothetical protein
VEESVALPDMVRTKLHEGNMTTVCDYEPEDGELLPAIEVLRDIDLNGGAGGHHLSSRFRAETLASQRDGPLFKQFAGQGPNSIAKAPRGKYERVGVGMLLKRSERGSIIVEDLAETGPAGKDGRIRKGDAILSVDGMRTEGKTLDAICDIIAGRPSTIVSLTVLRDEWGAKEFSVQLRRDHAFDAMSSTVYTRTATGYDDDHDGTQSMMSGVTESSAGGVYHTRQRSPSVAGSTVSRQRLKQRAAQRPGGFPLPGSLGPIHALVDDDNQSDVIRLMSPRGPAEVQKAARDGETAGIGLAVKVSSQRPEPSFPQSCSGSLAWTFPITFFIPNRRDQNPKP